MESLKNKVGKALFWSALQKYSNMAVTIVVSMVLARLLTPEQFGVVAISSVFINFLSVFSTMGIGPAIIQRNDLTDDDYNNIFTFSLVVGVAIAAMFFGSSWLIADFYGNWQLIPICQVLSISLLFSSINMVPNALMSKNKRFKELAKRTLILSVLSGSISIIAALSGFGIYSLLISPIINSIGIYFYNKHFYPVTISRYFSIEPIKRIFSYSIYQFAFEFSNFFSKNLDRMIIGKVLSPASLGYYDKAHNLMQMPTSLLTSVVSPVIQPFMSEYQDDMNRMTSSHNKMIRFLSTFSFPIAIILYFSATEIIHLFFGPGWERAIPCFQIFSLTLPTQIILSTSGAFWQSTNSTKFLFWVGLLNTAVTIVGYIVSTAIWGTIEAVAWSFVVSCLIAFFYTYSIMYYKVFRKPLLSMCRELVNPLFNVLILLCGYLLLATLVADINFIISLLIKLFFGLLLTIVFVQVTGRYNIMQIVLELNWKFLKK